MSNLQFLNYGHLFSAPRDTEELCHRFHVPGLHNFLLSALQQDVVSNVISLSLHLYHLVFNYVLNYKGGGGRQH
jgi:hypothetical protein